MYTVFINGRRWGDYKSLRDAKREKNNLKSNTLFSAASIDIRGPRGGKY